VLENYQIAKIGSESNLIEYFILLCA